MEFLPALALLALVKKLIDFLRYASARDVNGVVTQLVTWVSGFGALLLAAQTNWADQIMVGDSSLAALNVWSLVFVGMTVASSASVVHDVTKAVDNKDTAAIPKLLDK